MNVFFFSSRRRHTRLQGDWSSDVCSSDLGGGGMGDAGKVSTHPPSSIPHPALPTSAEKALLLLLLEGEPWRGKVLEAVNAEEFEFPAYRAVYEAAQADAPDRLDETAARAYEDLKAEGLA